MLNPYFGTTTYRDPLNPKEERMTVFMNILINDLEKETIKRIEKDYELFKLFNEVAECSQPDKDNIEFKNPYFSVNTYKEEIPW